VEPTEQPAADHAAPPSADAARALGDFLVRLRDAYGRCVDACARVDAGATLQLAVAALRYAAHRAGPPHVAVLGPTQTGKSTVVNLLAGRGVAEVSPLAGFTVHPQAVQIGDAGTDEWTRDVLPDWHRVGATELSRDDLEAWSLIATDGRPPKPAADLFSDATPPPPHIVWDTPDFDSLAAQTYIRGVLEIAALADVWVVVLSKEKYADLTVWQLLDWLTPLARSAILCVNKLSPDVEPTVMAALEQRVTALDGHFAAAARTVLPHDPQLAESPDANTPPVDRLRGLVEDALANLPAPAERAAARRQATATLIQQHWDDWLAPVAAEHAARAAWDALVEDAAVEFLAAYERDYLNHPDRYDAFRRAAVELLELLEIPGIASWMSRARRVVTWPARQVMDAGRSWWSSRRPARDHLHSLGVETGVLVDTLETLLVRLERDLARQARADQAAAPVWRMLLERLDARQPQIRLDLRRAIEQHHERFSAEIRAAARKIYAELQQHPARLAALRTGRATIDVGYLLLAVKTGGLTPLDALWAPATFGLTSLLMEGFAGMEMERLTRRLKTSQRTAVEEQFIRGELVPALQGLIDDLDGPGVFGITPPQIEAARAALTHWEAGDG
jgi:hypothetical protein